MNLPCVLEEGAERNSAILRFLDRKGLPWRDSVRDLIARFGVAPEPWYGWDTIPIGTTLLDGVKVQLNSTVYPYLTASWPLIYYTSGVCVGDDEHANFRHAVAQLEQVLGAGRDNSVSNTVSRQWSDDYATVDATIWPRTLKLPGNNPSHARHPFLAVTCSVIVQMRYLTPMSAAERGLVESFVPLHPISGAVELLPRFWENTQHTREFMRRPAPCGGKAFGTSADGSAIISVQDGVANLYRLDRIRDVSVKSIPDERDGPTTHRLSFAVPGDFGAPGELKSIDAATQIGGDPGELQALAGLVGETLRAVR
jgi:hypothetical protein